MGSCRAADEFHSKPERCCRLLANSMSSMSCGMGGAYPNELRYPKVQKVTPAVPAATHQALAPPSGKGVLWSIALDQEVFRRLLFAQREVNFAMRRVSVCGNLR